MGCASESEKVAVSVAIALAGAVGLEALGVLH